MGSTGFALMDAQISYTINMEIKQGPPGPFQVDNKPHPVVLKLISPISGTGRNITMANLFMSVCLVVKLKTLLEKSYLEQQLY